MRLRALRSLAAVGALAGAVASAGTLASTGALAASGELFVVTVDKARIARIPDRTQTLVIGQPGIADVTMLKNGRMGVVTGKSFGETNLIALDEKGNLLREWTVRVGAENSYLLVQNGRDRESFICSPDCVPTVDLADAKPVVAERVAVVNAHTGFTNSK